MYKTILADPPWPQGFMGKRKRSKQGNRFSLDYPSMTVEQIAGMGVAALADEDCHLWLWTTNQQFEAGFQVIRAWGFRYLAPVHWKKPTGTGNYFIHLTQTLLFGYRTKCRFPLGRYLPNWFEAPVPKLHSRKPEEAYALIERVSPGARLELFARPPLRSGWDVWGNEVGSSPVTIVGA